jgi:dTDP-4-dehydrorhamnose reductase
MRVWLSGGSGFVGRHLEFDEVLAPSHGEVDVTDAAAVRRSIGEYRPDVIVHAAIFNDFGRLEREGWAAYVGATRNIVDAAGHTLVILISTDWVFDGTQAPAREDEPVNPINLYGTLKAASELVVLARGGAVARISAVQGVHGAPRSQDAGFGYFVAAIVRALRAGERFTVWEGPPPAQPWPVPYDTRLDATATAATLGVELPDLDTQLHRLERSMACTT